MYCPTESMVADYFSKPLQGALLHKFRDTIMGTGQKDLHIYQEKFSEVIEKYEALKKEGEAAAIATPT